MAERLLELSELEPPDPLVLTLQATRELSGGEYLRMRHRRYPCLLFDKLRRDEFEHLVRRGREAPCEVFIWRCGDASAEAEAKAAAAGLEPWQE